MVRFTGDLPLDDLLRITGPAQVVHADPESLTPEVREPVARLGPRVWLNSLGDADQRLVLGDDGGVKALLAMGATILQTDAVDALVALRGAAPSSGRSGRQPR